MHADDETDAPDRDERGEKERRRLEGVLPDVLRRVMEVGFAKLVEGQSSVRHMVSDLKLPKEALSFILSQVDETKNGLYRVTAKEIRDFLDHTNMAEEIAKVLTMLSFEMKTEVRFIPNDGRDGVKPDVRAKVKFKRRRDKDKAKSAGSAPPAEPSDAESASAEPTSIGFASEPAQPGEENP